MWSNPKKEGELKKEGNLVKSWKNRWCILQSCFLFYFKSKDDSKPDGYIPLTTTSLKSSDRFKGRHDFVFELFIRRTGKVFAFRAASVCEMNDWISKIRSSVDILNVSVPFNIQHTIHLDFKAVWTFFLPISSPFHSSFFPSLHHSTHPSSHLFTIPLILLVCIVYSPHPRNNRSPTKLGLSPSWGPRPIIPRFRNPGPWNTPSITREI